MSPLEKAAFEKVIAVKGHPRAKEIAQLTDVARQAGLSETQLQTLRGLAARADWDLEKVKELKRTNQLSDDEAAALAKLQPFVSKLQVVARFGRLQKKSVSFRQVGKVAGLSDAETEALLEAVKQAGGDEQGLLQAKQANKLSAPAAAGLKKLEGLFGKLEDFVASPHKKEIGKLLEDRGLGRLEHRGIGRADEAGRESQLRPRNRETAQGFRPVERRRNSRRGEDPGQPSPVEWPSAA